MSRIATCSFFAPAAELRIAVEDAIAVQLDNAFGFVLGFGRLDRARVSVDNLT